VHPSGTPPEYLQWLTSVRPAEQRKGTIMDDSIIDFGKKYRGKRLSEVPPDYIRWLAEKAYSPRIKAIAQAWIKEHPALSKRSQIPEPAPRTRREAEKLSWMADRNYGNAKATLLAARDERGFLCIYVDEAEDEEYEYCLLTVSDDGHVSDAMASFESITYAQVQEILSHYPRIDGSIYLVEVAEMERMEREDAAQRLAFTSKNGRHTVTLHIYRRDEIEVEIDGRDMFPVRYQFRMLTEEERRDPQWEDAVAVLEPSEEGAQLIGLSEERRTLVEQKIQEQEKKGSH
jgi:hypothetical protein